MPVIIIPHTERFTVSTRLAYGLDMKMVDGIDEDGKIFVDAVRDLFESLTDVATMPPLFKIYPTKGYRLFLDINSRILEVATKHAKTVKQRIASGADGSETVGMLEEWLRDGVLTEEEAILQAVAMFAAGVDTVSIYVYNNYTCKHCKHNNIVIQDIRFHATMLSILTPYRPPTKLAFCSSN